MPTEPNHPQAHAGTAAFPMPYATSTALAPSNTADTAARVNPLQRNPARTPSPCPTPLTQP